MDADDKKRHQMVRSAAEFLRTNLASLGVNPEIEAVQALFRQLQSLDEAVSVREERAREFTRLKAEEERLREELFLRYLDPIDSVWKHYQGTPHQHGWPILAKPEKGIAIHDVLVSAERIAKGAKSRADELRSWGVSIDSLDELITALKETYRRRDFLRGQKTAATNTIPIHVGMATEAVRRAGKVLRPHLKKQPALLAGWKAASTIPKPPTQRLLPAGPHALPSGQTTGLERRLPATTGDQASVKLVITSPAKQLPASTTGTTTRSLMPNLVRTISARLSGPFRRLSDLMRGVEGREAGPPGSAPPPSND